MAETLRSSLSLKDKQIMYVSLCIFTSLTQSSYHLPSQTLVDTVIFHLNARTGEDALGVSKKDSILQGLDVVQGSLVEAYLLQTDIKMVVLFDEFLQVCVFIKASRPCSYLPFRPTYIPQHQQLKLLLPKSQLRSLSPFVSTVKTVKLVAA